METNKPTEDADEVAAVDVPDAVQEEARSIVRGAFRLFADHTQRMTDDLAEFNAKRRETSETLTRGIKRTSGRIV